MLTDDEKAQIEAELAHYDQKRGVVGEALKIVQRQRRWVSDESVRDIAGFLGLTPEEVDHVATFYSLIFRQPVGRHVILLCDSVSCYIMGYGPLREHLQRRLGITWGQTSADGRFTLLPVACLGACDHAPAMMIDEDLHEDLTAPKVDEALAKYD